MVRSQRRQALLIVFPTVALLLTLAIEAHAQGTTGLPPFSTIHASIYDDVKINDGAVLLNLPVWSKPGLIPVSYSLVFNNAVGTNSLESVQLGAWSPQTTAGLSRGLQWTPSVQRINCAKGQTLQSSHFQITDGYGTVHPVLGIQWDTLRCYPTRLSGATADGSGYFLTVAGPGGNGGTIYDRGGNVFSGSSAAPNLLTDTNGNQLSYAIGGSGSTSTYTFTDTTGLNPITEALTYTNYQVTNDVHSWTDPSGNTQSFTINYSLYPVLTVYGCYIPGDIGPGTEYLASSINTPEGTYTISYEATPGHPGDYTGRISKIIFPSGVSIQYTYSGGSNGLTCEAQTGNSVPWYNVMVPVLTRTVTDVSGYVRTWKYDTTQATNETVVTDPAGNDTVYLFYTQTNPTTVKNGIYETQRQIYQGSHASGALLMT